MIRSLIIFILLVAPSVDVAFAFNCHHHAFAVANRIQTPKLISCGCDVRTTSVSSSAYVHHPRGGAIQSTTLYAIPDISSLAVTAPTPEFVTASNNNNAGIISTQALAATASATLTYISLLAYFDRPKGNLAIPAENLLIQQSRVPGAGLGLFAARSLPKGTVLGTYPGVMRPAQTFYDGKCRAYPQAVGYSWRFTDSKYVMDPTDSKGEIQDYCLGGSSEVPLSNVIFGTLLQFWRVDTRLCRINEPPIGGGGCNVSARENLERREVVFELVQDVVTGQELYLDYGLDYDRSGYGPPPSSSQES